MSGYAVEYHDIVEARQRIASRVHNTPIMTCRAIDEMAGRSLFFKCENLQKVGAFKFRGATNALLQMSDEDASKGVVTHSSGNHAQAVALAAAMREIPAHIVMPAHAPAVKRRAVEGYGATVYPCDSTLESRETTVAEVIGKTGSVFIPPYNHPHIIAGQGTMALEVFDELDDVDAIIAPVGGGGMLSGISIATRGARSGVSVFGAEPVGADDAARSMAAGKLIPQTNPDTIADGLLTSLGDLTWPIIRDHVAQIITVPDDEILAAMRLVWERMKLIIEPSAAVPLAAVLSDGFPAEMHRVVVVFSGGNVDVSRAWWGLQK